MIDWLQRKLIPVTRYFGNLAAPWTVKGVTGEDYARVTTLIVPGDILVARAMGHFSNWMIPGYWKHAAIMGPHGTVIEAISSGVKETDLITFLTSKDEVAVVRPTFCGKWAANNAAESAEVWLGALYDYEFSLGNKAFYCAELCYVAYKTACPGMGFAPRERLGVLTVTADDFFQAKAFWKSVYDSRDH